MKLSELDKFRAARIELIKHWVFFGCVAMSMELIEDDSMDHAAATDGRHLYFNPALTEAWTFGETVGVVCHEVLHVVLLHHLRRGNRNPMKWNIACDYAVNAVLLEQFKAVGKNRGTPALPAGALFKAEYAGLPAEKIYEMLPDEPGGSGFDNIIDAAAGLSKADVAKEEAKIKATVQNAAAMARKVGQMGGRLEKLVEALCAPKASWRSIIRDYLTEKAEIDYNWALPHQRMLSQYGIVYPTLDGGKLGKVVMLVDASGSCANDQEQFCSEVSDILSAYECSIDVIFHDTKVTKIDHYESSDLPIVMRPSGFGGTDCKAAFDAAADFDPELIIYLTDLELSFSGVSKPDCDVVIACSRKGYFKNCPSWARLVDIR